MLKANLVLCVERLLAIKSCAGKGKAGRRRWIEIIRSSYLIGKFFVNGTVDCVAASLQLMTSELRVQISTHISITKPAVLKGLNWSRLRIRREANAQIAHSCLQAPHHRRRKDVLVGNLSHALFAAAVLPLPCSLLHLLVRN